ncbi:hypothetical protein GmHk_07G019362 [Glycine max]|nr:hypothetical protein GmHk_07G019362 [Glycine max]
MGCFCFRARKEGDDNKYKPNDIMTAGAAAAAAAAPTKTCDETHGTTTDHNHGTHDTTAHHHGSHDTTGHHLHHHTVGHDGGAHLVMEALILVMVAVSEVPFCFVF